MGTKNVEKDLEYTGLNHICWETGYAPERICCEYRNMKAASWLTPGKPLPAPQIGYLYHINYNLYLGNTADLSILWYAYAAVTTFQSYFKVGGGCNQGGMNGILCPIAVPGASGSPHMWEGGQYSLRINDDHFNGDRALDFGDTVVVPHSKKLFSEVIAAAADSITIRWARHSDGSNIKIKFNI